VDELDWNTSRIRKSFYIGGDEHLPLVEKTKRSIPIWRRITVIKKGNNGSDARTLLKEHDKFWFVRGGILLFRGLIQFYRLSCRSSIVRLHCRTPSFRTRNPSRWFLLNRVGHRFGWDGVGLLQKKAIYIYIYL